jgi:hypothetical protein
MAFFLHLMIRVLLPFTSLLLGIVIVMAGPALLAGQPPPPGQHDPKVVDRRIEEIRNRIERNPPVTEEQKELASFVRRYLDEAAAALNAGRRFQAQRFTDAADACRRPIDHLQHIASANQMPLPPGPPSGPPRDPEDQLRQVYFRLRLADFFLKQIPPPAPVQLLDLAREFYEQAVNAGQTKKAFVEDEYTKAADDLTHALENLAQAALP